MTLPRPSYVSPLSWIARRAIRPRGAYVRVDIPPRVVEIAAPHPRLMRFIPAGRAGRPLELHRLRRLAEVVRADAGVKGVVLVLSPLAVGFATCKSLRDVIASLSAAGKDVVVHMPHGGSLRDLYVASAASRVFLSPRASLAIPGLAAEVRYLRAGLDKLGVSIEPFRRAEFKTALETLSECEMSDPQREQTTALLEVLDTQIVDAIADGRGITRARVRELLAEVMLQGEDAVAAGLADGVAYEDDLLAKLAPLGEEAPKCVGAGRYLALLERSLRLPRRPYIAVVRVVGAIRDDMAVQQLGGPITALRHVGRDKRALGCVLLVDSPGGSALVSDLIHREVARLREKKPVVTCMGDVAASGGYYVAAGTDAIVAQPTTITGSIGVIAGRLLARDLLERVGVHTEVIRTAPHADMFSPAREADEDEKRILDAQVDSHYRAFVSLVADGRGRPYDDIEPLARGRVWAGLAAAERGLVDRLGGLDTALDEVRTRVATTPRVRASLSARLVHAHRGPLPPPERVSQALTAALSTLSPELSDLLALLRTHPTVVFYATGLPTIR